METKEFAIDRDFDDTLLENFKAFIASLTGACILLFDIESCGGYCYVFKEMKELIYQKKAEGYIIATNVDYYAYSAAFFFFLLGDLKDCDDEADFLCHPAGYQPERRLIADDLRGMLEEAEMFDEVIAEVIADNTKVAPEALNFLSKNENFLSKQDLIYLGFMEAEHELI